MVFSTVVQMVFGELFPKNLAISRPEPVARRLAFSTTLYLSLFGWLIKLFDASSNLLLRALKIEPVHDVEHSATVRDLEHIVAESREAGELPAELSTLLDRILDFPTRTAEHAMIPRARVDFVNQGDAAGLSVCTDKLHLEVPPSRRPAHLDRLFTTLGSLEPSGDTGLVPALHTIAEKIGQRALVVILSDLFTDPDQLADALQHLRYRKHDVCVFHLLDPQEIGFEFDRPHRFVDLEDGTVLVAEPNLIAEEYHTALREFLTKVRDVCHDANAGYQLVTTDTPMEELLRGFLMGRLSKRKH
jgi:hypothetical protein